VFWLICVTVNIQNVLIWLECRHGDIYATDQCQSTTLCSTQTHTSIRCRLKSFTSCAFFLVDSLPQIFIIFWSGLFGSQKSGSSYGSVTLLHFRTGGSELMHIMTGLTELTEKITTSRIYRK